MAAGACRVFDAEGRVTGDGRGRGRRALADDAAGAARRAGVRWSECCRRSPATWPRAAAAPGQGPARSWAPTPTWWCWMADGGVTDVMARGRWHVRWTAPRRAGHLRRSDWHEPVPVRRRTTRAATSSRSAAPKQKIGTTPRSCKRFVQALRRARGAHRHHPDRVARADTGARYEALFRRAGRGAGGRRCRFESRPDCEDAGDAGDRLETRDRRVPHRRQPAPAGDHARRHPGGQGAPPAQRRGACTSPAPRPARPSSPST